MTESPGTSDSNDPHTDRLETKIMNTTFSYACKDYPGMEDCPGCFVTESREELRQLIELHARVAHGEDPSAWSDEDKATLERLIRTD